MVVIKEGEVEWDVDEMEVEDEDEGVSKDLEDRTGEEGEIRWWRRREDRGMSVEKLREVIG